MNIKALFISLILIIVSLSVGNAGYWVTYDSDMDGDGTLTYPNEGWITRTAYDKHTSGSTYAWRQDNYIHSSGSAFNLYISGYGSMDILETQCYEHVNAIKYHIGGTPYSIDPDGYTNANSYLGIIHGTATPSSGNFVGFEIKANADLISEILVKQTVYVSPNIINYYNVSGSIECLDNVTLYTEINNTWQSLGINNSNSYLFRVIDGQIYKLIFSDAHEYEFTVNGTNIIYDHDGCIHTIYNFKESCGNLISDSEGFYIEKIGISVYAVNNFYASSGVLDILESPADNIYVSANPFSGQIGWFLDPITNATTYTLTNPIISWSLKVIVQNESTNDLINDAMVKVNQSCYCTDGYSVRQKLTTNGHADFTDMSLQDAGLFVMKTGYKILDESGTGYAAFLSGRSNFSSKTWIVKLAPSWSENESTFYESNNTVNIFFKNEDGNRTSKILDTDSNVYLYYENNNTDEEDMTLKFQSSSTHTHFIDEQSWNIPYGEIGHKTIVNADFTPWDYSYRAIIYNSSICGWNMTIPLTVRNATKEENQHYENLSTDLWFMYADAGKIDYRNNMDIGAHACSNNTSLMYVDIELYKDNVLLCYKNMTSSNFINADFPYYYVWSPAYSYESNSNYSVRMYGFDRTLLETDYVDCYTDDVTRKNKLTIIIKNHYGTNLDNAFVYLEDYGSIPTGTNYYTSFEGLDNGYYRFKASKPGYTGTGWNDITLSDSDEVVTYILTAIDSEAGAATQSQKVDENELQNIYLIIMAFLLIFIIIGGLKYAL